MDFWRRNQWPMAGGLGGAWLSLLLAWRSDADLVTASLMVLAVAIATGAAIVDGEQRRHRELAAELEDLQAAARAIAEAEADELVAARDLAAKVREIMLTTPLYRDVEAYQGWWEGQRAKPTKEIPMPPVWNVDGIVERGADGLTRDPRWYDMAQALRTSAETASSNAGTYARRLTIEASQAVDAVMKAAELAARAAEAGGAAAYILGEHRYGSADERRPFEERLAEARGYFIATLLNLQGSVERLERHGVSLPADEYANPNE